MIDSDLVLALITDSYPTSSSGTQVQARVTITVFGAYGGTRSLPSASGVCPRLVHGPWCLHIRHMFPFIGPLITAVTGAIDRRPMAVDICIYIAFIYNNVLYVSYICTQAVGRWSTEGGTVHTARKRPAICIETSVLTMM